MASMEQTQAPQPVERKSAVTTAIPAAPAVAARVLPALLAEPGAMGPAGRVPGTPGAAHLPAAALLGLQRSAGNAATAALLQRQALGQQPPAVAQRAALQREGGGAPGVSVKHTYTVPDKTLAEKDLSYVTAGFKLGGSVDYEVTPPPTPSTAAPEGAPSAPPAGPQVKASGGMNVGGGDVKYQAEVGVEFEKRAKGLLEGMTPKAKIGGEASGDKGKLGVEFSLEGEHFEPKFDFNLVEVDPQEGIHFATLEIGTDYKIKEFTFNAGDGATLKITPKVTGKIAIEPNYKQIFQYLLEEAGTAVAGEALIAGSMIAIGAITIAGVLLTIGDGEAEARAIDNAVKGRKEVVTGFVAGATGADGGGDGQFAAEGVRRGKEWRANLQAGKGAKGVPVPPSVIDVKAKENQPQIESSATETATMIMRGALVSRYWEIHYIARKNPFGEIDHVFMMLMEATGFGRPAPEEGKDSKEASALPE